MTQEAIYDGLKFLQTNRNFLGREFLTWLWFKSETQNHKIKTKNLGEFQLFIDNKIVLSSASGSVRENSLKGNSPAYAQEASAALSSGKMLQEAKFILQNQELNWSFSISAEDLSLRGVRLPNISKDTSKEHFAQRVVYTKMLHDILDELYKEYMDLRLTDGFKKETGYLQEWLVGKINSN
jgi:hypothetical protein